MRWRFAVSTGCCVHTPVLTALQALHDAGVRAVELGTTPRHFDPWRHDEVLELAHRLREFRMAPVAIHAPFGGLLDLTDPNPHHRHAAIGAILTAASALREMGGTKVVAHVCDAPRCDADLDERIAHAAASLRALARSCAHMDVLLLIETPLPDRVGGDPDEFAAVLKPLDRTVGVCFDTSHVTLGHHWDRFLEVAGNRLIHVHASDHRGHTDDHLPPGDGVIDWKHVASSLAAVGFDGWVVLELSCRPGPFGDYMAGALRRARTLFESWEV